MDQTALQERYRAGIEVTREAGALAAKFYRGRATLPIEQKGLQDFVSEADRSTEELIVTALSKAFPDDSFLGEEGGLRQKGPLLWVIDPIDGTANFVRGIPHWCVSVGLLAGRDPMLGFIYDPIGGEMFSATAGGGAFLNEEPIRVTGATELRQARIGLGFSFRQPIARHTRDIGALLGAGCAYSHHGSGALDLAYVAAGRLDATFERQINLWDVAAGLVIVREAGGRLSDFMAGDAIRDGNEILAATPGLYDPLRRLLDES